MALNFPNALDLSGGSDGQLLERLGVNTAVLSKLKSAVTGGVLTLAATLPGNLTLNLPTTAGTLLTDAPIDGTTYARKDGAWVAAGGGTPGGASTQVQFNNAGAFGGSALMTWDGTYFTANSIRASNSGITTILGNDGGSAVVGASSAHALKFWASGSPYGTLTTGGAWILSAADPGGSEQVRINGGLRASGQRSTFVSNSSPYAIAVAYGAGLGVGWIGASNSATPDIYVSNGGGGTIATFGNDLNVNIPNGILAIGTALSPTTNGAVTANNNTTVSTGFNGCVFTQGVNPASATGAVSYYGVRNTLDALIGNFGATTNAVGTEVVATCQHSAAATMGALYGAIVTPTLYNSGGTGTVSVATAYGIQSTASVVAGASGGTASATSVVGIAAVPSVTAVAGATATIGTWYGLYLPVAGVSGAGASIGTRYHVFQADTVGSNYFAAEVLVGPTYPGGSEIVRVGGSLRVSQSLYATSNVFANTAQLTGTNAYADIYINTGGGATGDPYLSLRTDNRYDGVFSTAAGLEFRYNYSATLTRATLTAGYFYLGEVVGGTYNGNIGFASSDQYPEVRWRAGATWKAVVFADVNVGDIYADVSAGRRLAVRDSQGGAGGTIVNFQLNGSTFGSKVTTLATATGGAGFNLPHGTAPSSPVDGDVWTTTAGMYARINGGTVGPFGAGGTPAGSNTQIQFNNSGSFGASANLTWNGTTLAVTGAITATALVTTPASSASSAGLRLPHGTAPSSPVDGDVWTTTAGMYARINGGTVGPFGAGGSGSPAGSDTQIQYNNAGSFGASSTFALPLSGGARILSHSVSTTSTSGIDCASHSMAVAPASGASGNYRGVYSIASSSNNTFLSSASLYGGYFSTSASLNTTATAPSQYGSFAALSASYSAASGTGAFQNLTGIGTSLSITAATGGTATAGSVASLSADATFGGAGGTVSVTTYTGLLLSAPSVNGTVTITNRYGIRQLDASARNEFSGIVGVGGATASTSTALITPASTTSVSSLRLPHGSAPSSPVNGDVWTTTSGLYARINGSTVGPFGAGLSYFTPARSTSAPNATTPAHALQASGAETNIDAIVTPKGAGALLAQTPDNTTTGGNKRGQNAVDLQMARSAATQVASGNNATVSGINCTASNDAAVALGNTCVASGSGAFAAGGATSATNSNAVALGYSTTASGAYASALGGHTNSASGDYSITMGRQCIAILLGERAFSSGRSATNGDRQLREFTLHGNTTDATPLTLTLPRDLVLPNSTTWTFVARVVGRRDSGTGTLHLGFEVKGVIHREGSAATTAIEGSVTSTSLGGAAGACTATANTTAGALSITVTGVAATTYAWAAHVEVVQAQY